MTLTPGAKMTRRDELRETFAKIVIEADRDWNGNVANYRKYIVDRLTDSGLFRLSAQAEPGYVALEHMFDEGFACGFDSALAGTANGLATRKDRDDGLKAAIAALPAPATYGEEVTWHDLASFMRGRFHGETSYETDARALLSAFHITNRSAT